MLPNTRLTLLAIAAVLALQFPSARAGAQSPPTARARAQSPPTPVSTVDEEITIHIPFSFHKLAAEIVTISAACTVWKHPTNHSGGPNPAMSYKSSESKPVSTMPKAADGSIGVMLTTYHVFKRAVDLTGTGGSYDCNVWGTTLAGPPSMFSEDSSDPRFKVTGLNGIWGSFTW